LTELQVVDGDITALDVDAIANAANNHLWMGSGVAGAIKRAGGEDIERQAVAQGPIEVGDAVATDAGRLSARWVVHGAVMGQDLRTNGDLVRQTTESCLRVADELGAESIALPAFGTPAWVGSRSTSARGSWSGRCAPTSLRPCGRSASRCSAPTPQTSSRGLWPLPSKIEACSARS
jgi:O-acetyl-ADP-ribose deacetylase